MALRYIQQNVDIPDTRMWVHILNTDKDLLAYLTSMPSYVADVLDYTYSAATEVIPEIAAKASAIDTAHRYMIGNATSDFQEIHTSFHLTTSTMARAFLCLGFV